MLEKTPESPLDRKEIKAANPKGNQHIGHLMRRADSLEMTLMLGKIEVERRRRQQRMRWLDSITDSVDTNLSKLWETVKDGEPGMLLPMGVTESDTT